MSKRKPIQPIMRVEKFFSGADFNLENEMGKEYFTDLNNVVYVFNIDYRKTKTHSLYGETKPGEKVVSEPTEIACRATIEGNIVSYAEGIKKERSGNLVFTTYESELDAKNVQINIGDYIGYIDPSLRIMRYFEVTLNNRVNNANINTHLGVKSYWRRFVCVPVDKDVFNG